MFFFVFSVRSAVLQQWSSSPHHTRRLHASQTVSACLLDAGPAASPVKATPQGSLSPPVPCDPQQQVRPKHWIKGDMIGQGAFGSVYLGMDNDTGQLMAIKQVGAGGAVALPLSERWPSADSACAPHALACATC